MKKESIKIAQKSYKYYAEKYGISKEIDENEEKAKDIIKTYSIRYELRIDEEEIDEMIELVKDLIRVEGDIERCFYIKSVMDIDGKVTKEKLIWDYTAEGEESVFMSSYDHSIKYVRINDEHEEIFAEMSIAKKIKEKQG